MPWIPYTYDYYVNAGIISVGLIGLVISIWRVRQRHLPAASYGRALGRCTAGVIVCLLVYTGYILARQAEENAERALCEKNMIQLGLCLTQYAEDYDDHFPPANAWATNIGPYLGTGYDSKVFQCPAARSPHSYAFNKALGGVSLTDMSKQVDTVMLFESDTTKLDAAGSSSNDVRFRHAGVSNVVFANGQVQGVNQYAAPSLNWKP